MATNFPASLDALTNPTSSDSLSSPSHSAQHANVNDAVEALQAKVGADSSAVTSSLDYKVAQLEAISHGKILQVVEGFSTTQVVVSTGTNTASGATATITPTSATSKVLVISYVSSIRCQGTSAEGFVGVYRGDPATTGTIVADSGQLYANLSDLRLSQTVMVLDTPATTSAITYYQTARRDGGTSITCQNGALANDLPRSSLVLMEVSA